MENAAKALVDRALELPASERIALAEELLKSLDRPDQELDELWAKEADSRLEAFENGDLKAIPMNDVFAKNKNSL